MSDELIIDLAREISRAYVYRIDKEFSLVESDTKLTGNSKKLKGAVCKEQQSSFCYSIKEFEKSSSEPPRLLQGTPS